MQSPITITSLSNIKYFEEQGVSKENMYLDTGYQFNDSSQNYAIHNRVILNNEIQSSRKKKNSYSHSSYSNFETSKFIKENSTPAGQSVTCLNPHRIYSSKNIGVNNQVRIN